MRSFGGWVALVGLAVLASGCPSGGGGGGSSNSAPLAVDDIATTAEDTAVGIDVLANDTDEDSLDLLYVTGFTEAANGTVSIDFDGTMSYEPDPDFSGSDAFTYTLSDGRETATASVAVTVSTVGDSPVAVAEAYDATEDVVLTVAVATGVLANDADVDSPGFTAVLDADASNGTVQLAADGSFTYTPDADFAGSDSFTYHATDGTQDSSIVVVSLDVAGVNDAPVADADGAYTTNEDTLLTVAAGAGVLVGDVDADGDALVALVQTPPVSGSLVLAADGSLTYMPNPDFFGSDSFTYSARDGEVFSAPATVSLTVTGVNDAPVGVADGYTGTEDVALVVVAASGVLANDTDVDPATTLQVDGAAAVAGPTNGVLAIGADGDFTYTPNADFNGTDSFTYRATDGTATSGLTTVTLTIGAANDAPVATNNAYTTDEDTALVVNAAGGVLLAGVADSDVDGDPLNALLATGPSNGTLALSADGSFTYTPSPNFAGPTDSFTYVARDAVSSSAPATVTITVNAVNDAPVAANDAFSGTEDTLLTVGAPGVLGNDTDVEASALTAALVTGPTNASSFALNADGSFSYTPAANFNGEDSFVYTANDAAASGPTTVTITVTSANDTPVANNDAYLMNEDTVLSAPAAGGVLIGGDPGCGGDPDCLAAFGGILDTDIDGDALNALRVTGPSSGTLMLGADGSFTYTPNPNFAGPTDSFTYVARDAVSSSAPATVTITVNAVNDTPVAADDAFSGTEDTLLSAPAPGVLANDSDVEGAVTAILDTQATNGTVALSADGSFTWTPTTANFNGTDSFTYHAFDGAAPSAIRTVTLSIAAVNDNPVATGDTFATSEDTPLSVAAPGVLVNDADADGDLVDAVVVGAPSNGTVSVAATGAFVYTPNANFPGPSDSFTYQARESNGGISAVTTVTITVASVNDLPIAGNDSYSTAEDAQLVIAAPGLLANDSDVESSVTAVNVSAPSSGSVVVASDGSFTYDPAPDFNGTATFTYQARDGAANSVAATVTITVNAVNDAPTFANAGNVTVLEDAGPSTSSAWASSISAGPTGESSAGLVFEVVAGNPSAFSAQPAVSVPAGDLTFTPAPNAFGSTPVTVTLVDGQGARSAAVVFQVVLTGSNDPPELTLPPSITVFEDSGTTIVPFATITGGAGGEPDAYYVFVNNDNGGFFEDPGCFTLPNCGQPFIDLDGTLSFRLRPDMFGSVNVNVTVQDINGAQTNGSFALNVTGINDSPSFTAGPDQSALDVDGQRVVFGWANPSSAGPNEGSQTLSFTVSNDNNGIFSEQPNVDSSGTLRFTPFGAGTFGTAVVSVFVTDDGSPPLSSSTQTFEIVISNPTDPPSLISSTPDPVVDGNLSYQEAFGPGGQLIPAIFSFDDPNLDCAGIVVDVTQEATTLVEDTTFPFDSGDYIRDCSIAGQLNLTFRNSLASVNQGGDTIQIDLTNIFDTEPAPGPYGPGAPVSINFLFDSQAPQPQYLDDFFSCRANPRAIAKFNEAMDVGSASGFVYEQLPQGPGVPVPVVVEPAGGAGFATLDNPDDTYFFVPRDHLEGGFQYRVNTSGFRDVAGNLATGQTDVQFGVCGFGGGGPGPGGIQIDRLDFLTNPIQTIDDAEIVNNYTLVSNVVAGTGSGLDVVFNLALDPATSNGSLRVEEDNGGGPDPEFFSTESGTTMSFRPTDTDPSFRWTTDARYSVGFNVCTPPGPGQQCTGGSFTIQVKVAGDTVAPRLTAVSGRRSSASPNNARPLLRPEEPLGIGFSEELDRRTIVSGNFAVTLGGSPVAVLLPDDDDGGFGTTLSLRADRGDGQPGSFAPGVYTLTVSGVLDIGESQNALLSTARDFEVGILGSVPAFVSTLPADGDVDLDTGNLTVFATFNDAMSRGSFVDTGAPATRGFRLEERFQGSFGPGTLIPKKGLTAASTGCCGGPQQISAVEPEIVALQFDTSRFIGFRQDTEYEFNVEPNLKNVDGTVLGGLPGPTVTFSTTNPGNPNVRPTVNEFRMDVEAFEPNTLRFQGFPLTSSGRVTVRFNDPNGSPWNLTVTGTGGSASFSSGGNSFDEIQLSDLQLASMFNESTPEDVTFLVEDAQLNASLAAAVTYLPGLIGPAAVAVDTAGQVTFSGTILAGSDAARIESVEVLIFLSDDSSGTPDVRDFVYGAMTQVTRNADGSLSYSHTTSGLVLPDPAPFSYRALTGAQIPAPRSTGGDRSQVISRPTAPIPPNAPGLPVTLSGIITEDDGAGGGVPQAGALVELVGTTDQTTTDANGFWSLTVQPNQLRYLRVTEPAHYGIQVLVTTVELSNLNLPIFPPAVMQTFYNGAGAPGPVVDVADGSVYLEPNPSVPFTADLGTLTFEDSGNFGGNEQLFQNVLAGSSTLTLTGPSPCSVSTFGANVPSPLAFEVEPNVLTYVPMECSP